MDGVVMSNPNSKSNPKRIEPEVYEGPPVKDEVLQNIAELEQSLVEMDQKSSKNIDNVAQKASNGLVVLNSRIDEVAEYSVKTRELTNLSSHSIELLGYHFKQHVVDTFAARHSLSDVESELSERQTGYEAAVRDRSSLTYRLAYLSKYIDPILRHNRALTAENSRLQQQIKELTIKFEAAKQTIANTSNIVNILGVRASKKALPADLIAELRTYAPEIIAAANTSQIPTIPIEPQNYE